MRLRTCSFIGFTAALLVSTIGCADRSNSITMQAQPPTLWILALAVGAGVLAVLVLWVSKQVVNEKTRSQGILAAAIILAVLLLGFFVMPTRTVVQMTPVPATVTSGVTGQSSISMERNGAMEVHVHNGHPIVAAPNATAASSAQNVGQAKLAWGPVTIAVIAVGVIAIVVSSKRGMAAALACLGIVAAVLVMYLFAARHSTNVAWVPERAPPLIVEPPAPPRAITEETREAAEIITESASTQVDSAEQDSTSDVKAEAESAPHETAEHTRDKTAAETPAPAWIGSEPTYESGVYRAAVVSGPYSTKRECEAQLDKPLREAMMEFAKDHLRPSAQFHAWGNTEFIRNNLIEERYLAEQEYGVGKMYNLHVRLKVDPEDVARFNALAQQWQVREAVEETSIGGLLVFGSLVVAYVSLRYFGCKKRTNQIDTATPAPPDAAA